MNIRPLICSTLVLLAGCASTTTPTLDATGTVACVAVSSLTVRTTTVYVHADTPGRTSVKPDCSVDLMVLPAMPADDPAPAAPDTQ